MTENFLGVFTALVTPFSDDGSVDLHKFESLINDQIRNGVHGLVVCGTTGESPCLSEEESFGLIKSAVDISAGRVSVIAGVGSNNTSKTCIDAVKAQELGVDGVLVIAPYYNKPSKEGIIAHFTEIDSKISIPIIVYNHPGRTGIDVDVETLVHLSKLKNVVGVKDVSGDPSRVLDVSRKIGDHFVQLLGNDPEALSFYSHGGHGVISVASNIISKEMVEMHNKFLGNDFLGALDIYKKHFALLELLGCEINPVPVKYCAELMGICSQNVRLPLVQLQNHNKDKIKRELSKLKVI